MRFIFCILALSVFLAVPGFARELDYSGCNSIHSSTGLPTDFDITPAGRLLVDSVDDKKGIVYERDPERQGVSKERLKRKVGPAYVTVELLKRDGIPQEVQVAVPAYDRKEIASKTTYKFGYEKERCHIDEISTEWLDGEWKGKKLIVYHHEMCDELADIYSAKMKLVMEACGRELAKVNKVIGKYQVAARAEGKELYYFQNAGLEENPMIDAVSTMAACQSTRQQYADFKYKNFQPRRDRKFLPAFLFGNQGSEANEVEGRTSK